MRGPEPPAPELETPRFERGVVLTGTGKAPSNRAGLGFRVYKPRVSNVNRERLKTLYNDVVNYILLGVVHELKGSKYLAYYADEWIKEWQNVLRMREEAGKRTLPKMPPLFLPVRFIMPDGEVRGNKSAPVIIDLRKNELRIPSYGVAISLRKSIVKALVEENKLEPRPDFVMQITRKGFLRIIAHRLQREDFREPPLRLICIDENSIHGFVVAIFDYDGKWRLTHFRIYHPPNHGYHEGVISLFQSFADKPAEETRNALAQRLDLAMTPERARELARKTKNKERKKNDEFIRQLIGKIRKAVRDARRQNIHVAVLVDPINPESLKGTPLQRTLLRTRRYIRNLCLYEGAEFRLLRSTGKQCPICGSWGVKITPRTYQCPRCGVTWDRDRNAVARLPILYFKLLYESYREKCDDYSALPLLLLHKYIGFLKRRVKFLSPFPSGAGEP